jgi:predicted nucleotidyltransferase
MSAMATTRQEFPALAALAAILHSASDAEVAPPSGPPPSLEQLRERREEIIAIATPFGASDLRVIGSVARGTAAPTSDVDFLVTLEPERSLLDLGGLQVALEDFLGCAVHVVKDGHAASATATGTPSDDREERLLARLRADAVPV